VRIRDRIRYNFGSNAFGFIVSGFGQLLLIPMFLRHWSPSLMGEWMVLWSVPAMIWAVEQMMTGASGNRMIRLHTLGEIAEANTCFHHLLFLHGCLAVLLLSLALLCLSIFPVAAWLHLKEISPATAQHISALIFAYMILVVFANIIRLPFSAVGKPWLGGFHWGFTQAAILISQITLLSHPAFANPLFLAWGILATHALCLGILLWLFHCTCRPYTLAWQKPSGVSLNTILADNLPLTGFVFSQSVLAQVFMISIQLALGPYFVSAFSILKTLSRTFYQGANAVIMSTGPDLTSAVARGDVSTIQKIGRLQLVFILPAYTVFVCLALPFHDLFLNWWAHGKVSFSNQEICIFLVGVFFLTLWSRQSQLLLAALHHRVFYGIALGLSLFYAGAVFTLRPFLSFDGFLAAASLFEASLYFISRVQARFVQRRFLGTL